MYRGIDEQSDIQCITKRTVQAGRSCEMTYGKRRLYGYSAPLVPRLRVTLTVLNLRLRAVTSMGEPTTDETVTL